MPSYAGQRSGHSGGGAVARSSGGSSAGGAQPRGSVSAGPGHPGTAVPRPYYPGGYGHYPYYGYGHYPYYGYPYYGYGYPYYGYGYGYPGVSFSVGIGVGYPYAYAYPYPYAAYAYPPPAYPGYVAVAPGGEQGDHGGAVRIEVEQRDADVFVDGYRAGVVADFSGSGHQMNLQTGTHRVEIRHAGFETETFDVDIQPGQTVTLQTRLRPSAN